MAGGQREVRVDREAAAQAAPAAVPLQALAMAPELGAREAEVVRAGLAKRGEAAAASHGWQLRTVANGVTVARLACTPLLVVLVLHATPSWAALVLWVALTGTDAADGWIARRRGTTASGAFLDPLADKFLVLGALFAMAGRGVLPLAPVVHLASREVLMTWYRVVVARRGISVPARLVAKTKTVAEFVTVGLVLLPVIWSPRLSLSHFVLWSAVGLAWLSAAQYMMDGRARRRALASGA
ncbi:MAG: CDP-alcohol phosphatidyltransferase family protein [Acidimicrobiales bacterium]